MSTSARALPWVVLLTLWVTLGAVFGLFFSFPVFLVPLLEEFRWSRAATAATFSVSAIVQGMLSPLVGALVDRFGPRRIIVTGVATLGTSCLLASRVAALSHLYLVVGVLAAAGVCGAGWVPASALIARWFAHRRGSLMGLAFSGMGVGVLTIVPLAQWLISSHGWRDAYLALGAGALLLLVPLTWFGIREAPPARRGVSEPGRDAAPDGRTTELRAALTSRRFWALFFAYLFTPLAVFPVVTHQVAFAVDQGVPRLFVAGIFGLTGLMSVVGRIVFGIAADRIGRALSATLSYGCTAVGTLALLSVEAWHQTASLYVYALLFGLGFGARGPIISTMASHFFPGRRFGAIYGVLSIGNGVGGAIGPWFAGALYDWSGSYRTAFLLAAGFCAAGAACFWIAEPRAASGA